jgi:tripartite-type tricarboxylate transporter receptor subunit TctC
MTRRCALVRLSLAAVAGPYSHLVAAQSASPVWPNKPVRIVLPFPPGGTSDVFARLLADKLKAVWGQAVVVESKPGANGIIASDAVAKAVADGHTLLFASGAHAINASLYPKLPYDTARDFSAVAMVVPPGPMVLAIHSALPIKNLRDLVEYARANPGKLSYASAGTGNSLHLAGEMLAQMANIKLLHVPYKGAGPALTDVVAGQVNLMFNSSLAVASFVKEGRLRLIAQTGSKRSGAMPDLPTLQEQGLSDFEVTGWFGLFAPARTPSEVVQTISSDVNRALQTPELREKLMQLGSTDLFAPASGFASLATPTGFSKFVDTEVQRFGKVIRTGGISVDPP